MLPTVAAPIYSTHDPPTQIQATKRENEHEHGRCPSDPVPNSHTPREFPAPPSPPRANHRRTMNIKPFPAKDSTMATSAAPPTPSATAGTDSVNVYPAPPLLLRTAAHPGLDHSRDQRPSSPVSSTLAAPPPHIRAFAPFWDTIPADIKRQVLQVPFHDVEQSVEDTKAGAAVRSTRLADDENRKTHDTLAVKKNNLTAALQDTRNDLSTLEREIGECKIRVGALEVQERSAEDAVNASSGTHHSYTAGFRATPYSQHQPAAAPAKTSPPPPRVSVRAAHHTRPTQDPPVRRSEPPAT